MPHRATNRFEAHASSIVQRLVVIVGHRRNSATSVRTSPPPSARSVLYSAATSFVSWISTSALRCKIAAIFASADLFLSRSCFIRADDLCFR